MSSDPTENEFIEDLDEKLDEIEKMYRDVPLWQRLKIMSIGLKSSRKTKEYKVAMIELQRMLAPAAAVIIPVLAVLILAIMSATQTTKDVVIETQVIEAEELKDLDEIEEFEPPEEQTQDIDIDIPIDAPNVQFDNAAPAPNQPVSPQPQAFDAVMTVKSPVILKNIYGSTRNTGTRGVQLARFGGDKMTEGAVLRALRWLKKNQRPDGSWNSPHSRTAMTGLAILTFLAHGEKPGDPEFGPTVQKALEFLMSNQRSDGRFACMDPHQYAHPIATYALCEAYGMTLNPNVRDAASRALGPIINGQHPTGGWTYYMNPKPEGNGHYRDDTSFMGWCAQALKAAKLSRVPGEGLEKAIKLAIKGFKKNAHPDGGFGYISPQAGSGLTGVGTLSMLLLGAGNDKDVRNGQKVIDNWTPAWGKVKGFNCPQYYFYYATQCKFHQGGSHWTRWNKAMKGPYVKAQIVEKNAIKDAKGKLRDIGHWQNSDIHSSHPVMDTCLAALQLMVYYRYLPTTSKQAVQVEEEIVATSTDKEDIDVDVGNL